MRLRTAIRNASIARNRGEGKTGRASLNRRAFMGSLGILASATGAGCVSPSTAPAGGILDTHVHFYDPSRPEGVPWPPAGDPVLYRTVLPDELERLARPLDVTGAIVVEASPLEEDNQWVLDLAATHPWIRGVVGHLKPGRPGFADALDRFARNPLFRGIRTGLWKIAVSVDDPGFVRDLARLADRGLALDIGAGVDPMEAAVRLAARLPDLRIVMNHFGAPRIRGEAPDGRWCDAVRSLGRVPNVFMKLSGLVEGTGRTGGDAPADLSLYRPFFDVVWNAFGPERILFGSNWPVSARCAPYETVLGIARSFLMERGGAAIEAGLRTTAMRAYGLAPRFTCRVERGDRGGPGWRRWAGGRQGAGA